MIIVLDTNVIHSDFLMKSVRFEILFDYVQKTHSKFIIPKIVYEELAATYERELQAREHQFVEAKRSLTALLTQTELPRSEISIESEVSSFLNHLKDKLNVTGEEFFDYKEVYFHDAVERAVRRKRPCTDRGEGMRDAILWRSVLDIASEAPEKTVVFISQNTKHFAQSEGILHSDLIQECSENGVAVKYFTSLDAFAKQHASSIDFINEEWVLASIDTCRVLEEASGIIEKNAESALDRLLSGSLFQHDEQRRPTGYFNPQYGSSTLHLESFYVYEMSDGSLRIEATLTVEIEVECEFEKIKTKAYFTFGKIDPTAIRHFGEVKTEYIYVYPEVSLNLEIIVRDKAAVSWKVIE